MASHIGVEADRKPWVGERVGRIGREVVVQGRRTLKEVAGTLTWEKLEPITVAHS